MQVSGRHDANELVQDAFRGREESRGERVEEGRKEERREERR